VGVSVHSNTIGLHRMLMERLEMTTLSDELLAHQVATIKHGVELGNSVEPYMRLMKAIIRKEVAGFDAEKRTAKRLETLIKKLSAQLKVPADDWLAELESQLKEFAKYEANYQAEVIGGFVKMDLVAPTVNQIWAAAMFEPLSLSSGAVDFTAMMKKWSDGTVARLSMAVKEGFTQALSVSQIIKKVVGDGGASDISLNDAKVVAQTALAHVASEARFKTYEDNDDVVIGYQWVSTLDSRTSTVCFDGQTEIAPIAGANGIMKSSYNGPLITVNLSTGKQFTGTPKHPILTQHGWTALDELDPGKHILYSVTDDVFVFKIGEHVNMPSKAAEIFDSFVKLPGSVVERVGSTAADFYGDGVFVDGEIHTVYANGKLRYGIDASAGEHIKNSSLSSVHAASTLPSVGHPNLVFFGERVAAMPPEFSPGNLQCGIQDAFGDSCFLDDFAGALAANEHFDGKLSPGVNLLWYEPSRDCLSEADLLEECRNGGGGSIILPGDAGSRLSVSVTPTNIVSMSVKFGSSHVYTLSSDQGYYAAGGAIVKNCRHRDGIKFYWDDKTKPKPPAHFRCRSTTRPLLSPEFDFLQEGAARASSGASGGKPVAADTTYYGWLKNQPSAYQDSVLGPTKGKVFRNSGLSPEEFRQITVTDLGTPLTLKQMVERDKRVNQYMKKEYPQYID
jgi:intein/homing endonuclease